MNKPDLPAPAVQKLPVEPSNENVVAGDRQKSPQENKQIPVIHVDGKAIPCPAHYHNILDCLEEAGVEVHYHCRDGFCGACRVTLCQGETVYPQGEPLAFVGEGEVLTCCSLPLTDIDLVID